MKIKPLDLDSSYHYGGHHLPPDRADTARADHCDERPVANVR